MTKTELMLWLRRGRHLLGIIQPALSKLIRHLLPWCSIRAGINGVGLGGGMWSLLHQCLGGGEGWRAQSASKAQCWGEKAEVSANHVSTRHSWQVLSCIWGAVCNVKKTCHFHGFQAKLKKYFYFHFLIPIQLCIFFYLISRVKLTFKFISDVNGKPFPWSQSGLYVSIPD